VGLVSDIYKCTCPIGPREVDLDDLSIYSDRLLKMDVMELHQHIWTIMGRSLFYMQYFWPEMKEDSQYCRVDKMCKEYVENRKGRIENNENNRLWLLKLVFRFEDEVENQC
jgi:hypothetical protein